MIIFRFVILILLGLLILYGHLSAYFFNKENDFEAIGGLNKDTKIFWIFWLIWVLLLLLPFVFFHKYEYVNSIKYKFADFINSTNTGDFLDLNNEFSSTTGISFPSGVESNDSIQEKTLVNIPKIWDEKCGSNSLHYVDSDKGGRCVPNIRVAYSENGLGEEYWIGDGWSNGVNISCLSGYLWLQGACVNTKEFSDDVLEKLNYKSNNVDLKDSYYSDQSVFNYCEWERVSNILDGDTFDTSNGDRVRIIGVDTPELSGNECFSYEAKIFLKSILDGKEVCLLPDTTSPDLDVFNRKLRYVFLQDGTFVNAEILKKGCSKDYLKYDFDLSIPFYMISLDASANKIGVRNCNN